ncbi:uncharacterized protein LOC116655180 [Drosophila ananassae]|uniref:uncharacterized protein LOC116655180 n=1 Tax=Drosophila ananassae TaxID=7217 RepID=UPI0013A5D0A4|nr:uncharacterized protein LOC116655180 [Drosophila ananassae]
MPKNMPTASLYPVSSGLLPSDVRTYGFLKPFRSNTPNPVATASMDHAKLREKLQRISTMEEGDSQILFDETSLEGGTPESEKSLSGLAFERKRKLFDTAEFTIAKGKKMSEMFHPNSIPTLGDTAEGTNIDDIKRYIREMRLNITR